MTRLSKTTLFVLAVLTFAVGCGDDTYRGPGQAWSVEERPEATEVADTRLLASSASNAIAIESAHIHIETAQPRTCIELQLWAPGFDEPEEFPDVEVSPGNWQLTLGDAWKGACGDGFEPENSPVATLVEASGRVDLVEEYTVAQRIDRLEVELQFEGATEAEVPREVFLDVRNIRRD